MSGGPSLSIGGLLLRTPDKVFGPFTIDVAAGEKLLLVGPSGSGKSLLLAVLAGLRPATVVAGGARVPRPLGVVFPRDALEHEASVVDNVMSAGVDRSRAVVVLSALGLADVVDSGPQALSGGQRRRVALARALADSPKALLLDDPTAGLDPTTASEVLTAIDALAADAAVIIASPDVDVVAPFARKALWLGDEQPRPCLSSSLPPPFSPRPLPRLVAA